MEQLGERLLNDLCKCFKSDPAIDEYDFLPVLESTVNKNPFVTVDHKLGIESWAVKILFQCAYDKLMRSQTNKLALWDEFGNCSRAVLMINADNQTAWNLRKLAIQQKLQCPQEDLKTNSLILRKHPKSPESFAHRKWVVEYICRTGGAVDVVEEFSMCTRSATGYANNYNAWTHRLWVMERIFAWDSRMIAQELERTVKFVERHVSDHSGLHYRQQLLSRRPQYLWAEVQRSTRSIRAFPGHEALWYHRRALVHQLLQSQDLLYSLHPSSPNSPSPKRSRIEKGQGDSSTSDRTDCDSTQDTIDNNSTRDTIDCSTRDTIDCSAQDTIDNSTRDTIDCSTQDTIDCSTQDTIDCSTRDTIACSTVGNSGDSNTQDEDRKRNLLRDEEEFCEEVFRAGDVENAEWQIQLAQNYLRWLNMIQNR